MHTDTVAAHRHDHIFLSAHHDRHERRTRWVVVLTAVMMVGEIAAGWLFGSMALLADGFHMATHAGALAVAAGAYAYARRHAHNQRFTFGTGKIGDLAGFASALALGLVALGIAVDSFERLLHPGQVAFHEATIVAVVGLAVNLVSAALLRGGHDHGPAHHHEQAHYHGHECQHHGHHHHGHAHNDNNLRSAYLHVLADALTSVLAIAALLAGRYLGWVWLDAAMGVVGALVIARWSWHLMRDTAAVLVDAADTHLADEIRTRIEVDGDAKVSDLHVWQVGPGAHAAIVSLVAGAPQGPDVYKARLRDVHELVHVTVETHHCQGAH